MALLKRMAVNKSTVYNGGASRARDVAVDVGCWHFNDTSMTNQQCLKKKLIEK